MVEQSTTILGWQVRIYKNIESGQNFTKSYIKAFIQFFPQYWEALK